MSKKNYLTTLGIVGTAFAASLAASNVATAAQAGANPFAMNELSSGYMQVAKEGKCGGDMEKGAKDGKCGEGKCGGDKGKKKDMKEGKCGEGKCGGDKGKKKDMKEGKCGEGKCGGK